MESSYHSSSDDSSDESSDGSSDGSSDSSNAIDWIDDDFEMMAVVVFLLLVNNMAIMAYLIAEENYTQMVNEVVAPDQDNRHGGRKPKAIFRHHEAFHCIQRDYFGIPGDLTTPIFKDRNFEMMFRLSRTRVQKIFEDVMQSGNAFYLSQCDGTGVKGASVEAKILLPLKTLAFGTASHAFCDYFQMSKPLALLLRSTSNFASFFAFFMPMGREILLPCAGTLLFTLLFLALPVLLLLVLLDMTSSSSVLESK